MRVTTGSTGVYCHVLVLPCECCNYNSLRLPLLTLHNGSDFQPGGLSLGPAVDGPDGRQPAVHQHSPQSDAVAPEPLPPLLEPDAQPGDPAAAGGMRGQDTASAGSWRGQQVRFFGDGSETVCVFACFFFNSRSKHIKGSPPKTLVIMTKHSMHVFWDTPHFQATKQHLNEFYATRQGMLSSAKWHAAADDRLSDCGKVASG